MVAIAANLLAGNFKDDRNVLLSSIFSLLLPVLSKQQHSGSHCRWWPDTSSLNRWGGREGGGEGEEGGEGGRGGGRGVNRPARHWAHHPASLSGASDQPCDCTTTMLLYGWGRGGPTTP
jgi:hypothetical protein